MKLKPNLQLDSYLTYKPLTFRAEMFDDYLFVNVQSKIWSNFFLDSLTLTQEYIEQSGFITARQLRCM